MKDALLTELQHCGTISKIELWWFRVNFNLGMLAMDDGDAANAETWFKQAIAAKPSFRSALFNLALLLNEQRRPLDALPHLLSLHRHFPDHVKVIN